MKWEGFRVEHNSWKPWDSIHAPDLVTDFHWTNPGAPRQIWFTEFNTIPFHPMSSLAVLGHHSLEGGVDVRGHTSQPTLPIKTTGPDACYNFLLTCVEHTFSFLPGDNLTLAATCTDGLSFIFTLLLT